MSALSLTCLLTVGAEHASALTVVYQPTPATRSVVDSHYPPATNPSDNLAASHVWEGFLTNARKQAFIESEQLIVGGRKGVQYQTYVWFDLTGLPLQVDQATLELMPYSTKGSGTVEYAACLLLDPWLLSMDWKSQPSFGDCSAWYPAPTTGVWSTIHVTSWYNGWRDGSLPSYGIVLIARSTKSQFDVFRSTAYSAYASDPLANEARPRLRLTYDPPLDRPDFKLPLPPGKWLLSNEIGGHECLGQDPWPDKYHQGNSYFSLDFLPMLESVSGPELVTDVPVLAAEGGTVVENSYTAGNGYYVTINHSGSQSLVEGYTSKYLHLVAPSPFPVGTEVEQGEELGLMGNSGDYSTGTHLHFGVYYNGSGTAEEAELAGVTVDGLLMKSYQTECSYDSAGKPVQWIRYYESTNEPCGILCGDFGEF